MKEVAREFTQEEVSVEEDSDLLYAQLERLKTTGSNILITGAVSPDVSYHATKNLLGSDGTGTPRKRLLAASDLNPPSNHYLLTSYEDPPEVVCTPETDRGGTTVDSPIQNSSPFSPTPWLKDFQQDICETIAALNASVLGLEPAQLRLSVLTLRPIIENECDYECEQFLRVVTDMVERVSGMGHYHLPVSTDSVDLQNLMVHFDVHVELRKQDLQQAESRWHFADVDITTPWYKL